jgi:hypothetical protein
MAEPEDSPAASKEPTGDGNNGRSPHGEDPVPRVAVDLDVSWPVSPDMPAIDVLARLHVVACRDGRSLWLHGASRGLVELLDLAGLREIVHLCARVWLAMGTVSATRRRASKLVFVFRRLGSVGEPEDREQGGFEEGGDLPSRRPRRASIRVASWRR